MKNLKASLLLVAALLIAGVGVARAEGGIDLAYFGIPSLDSLAPSAVAAGDFIPVYDVSADKVKRVDATGIPGFGAGNLVSLAVDTTLTSATHANRILVLGGAGSSRTFTMPAATGSGAVYTFVVGAVNTSNYVITKAGSDTMNGSLLYASDNASNAALAFEASGGTITLNGTTKGGASIGDRVTLTDCVTTKWCVSGQVTETGSETTPFS